MSDELQMANIFAYGELHRGATVSILETVRQEFLALNRQAMTMQDWLKQVRRFMEFNEQEVLEHAGKISHEMAVARAHAEYDKFRVRQDRDYLSNFDLAFAKYLQGGPEA